MACAPSPEEVTAPDAMMEIAPAPLPTAWIPCPAPVTDATETVMSRPPAFKARMPASRVPAPLPMTSPAAVTRTDAGTPLPLA